MENMVRKRGDYAAATSFDIYFDFLTYILLTKDLEHAILYIVLEVK